MNRFKIGQDHLTVSLLLSLVSGKSEFELSREVRERVLDSNRAVQAIAESDRVVYGINTGFGPLCTTKISKAETALLQEKLLISHSVGVGDYIRPEIAKAMLILKLHALAKGYSGVSVNIVDRIIWHINNNIIPAVPSQGSVGASGDLAPLAHLFLPLIGKGKLHVNGKLLDTAEVFSSSGLEGVLLGPKDILALINGTQFIAAHAAFLVEQTYANLQHADLISAIMIEGLQASTKPFGAELHALRPYPANQFTAGKIATLLDASEINQSHQNCLKVQDPYSLRCIPQVHGASRTAWFHLKESLEIEMNAVTDNPIIFDEHFTVSGGNFHGQPMALPIDYVCLANSEIGSISDRRMYLALHGDKEDLPRLLVRNAGVNSGFMILQYTAAALASENKSQCFPASADSIPTSLGQEDHVSMGSIGARKALKVSENTEKILAIELICAAQALDFRRPLQSTPVVEAIHKEVRQKIAFCEEDRLFSDDIALSIEILHSKALLEIEKKYKDGTYSDYDERFEIY